MNCDVQVDSKLLPGFPFTCNGNIDNNLESSSIIINEVFQFTVQTFPGDTKPSVRVAYSLIENLTAYIAKATRDSLLYSPVISPQKQLLF
jgi:hypothetical protein